MNLEILIKQGIGDVRFGMTMAEAEKILGQPTETENIDDATGEQITVIHYDDQELSLFFEGADKLLNCINESPARRFWTAPKQVDTVSTAVETEVQPSTVEVTEPAIQSISKEVEKDPDPSVTPIPQEENMPIEATVIAAQEEDGPSVFDDYTKQEIKDYNDKKEKEKKESRKKQRWRPLSTSSWGNSEPSLPEPVT